MSRRCAIEARNAGKSFFRKASPLKVLAYALTKRAHSDEFWAVQDVNLKLFKGDSVGIVGRNGSGKSTLLQLICGTLHPTTGAINVDGKIVAMLELGAGFNPNFSGRENAYLCASAYGLDKGTIKKRIGLIEDFAEIGDYFDRPVLEYSSGMYARLAFAVCAHVDADILVVDEILGVGDAGFQRKCQRFMQEFQKHGTLLFVSHAPEAVISVCKRAIWLDEGRKVADGNAEDVMKAYTESLSSPTKFVRSVKEEKSNELYIEAGARHSQPADFFWGKSCAMRVSAYIPTSSRHGFGQSRIENCFFSDDGGNPVRKIYAGDDVSLHILARTHQDLNSPIIGFMFRNELGQNLFGDNTYLLYRNHPLSASAGQTVTAMFKFRMPYLPDGRYMVAPSIVKGTQQDHIHLDWQEEALLIDVANSPVKCGKMGLAMRSISLRNAEMNEDYSSDSNHIRP